MCHGNGKLQIFILLILFQVSPSLRFNIKNPNKIFIHIFIFFFPFCIKSIIFYVNGMPTANKKGSVSVSDPASSASSTTESASTPLSSASESAPVFKSLSKPKPTKKDVGPNNGNKNDRPQLRRGSMQPDIRDEAEKDAIYMGLSGMPLQ